MDTSLRGAYLRRRVAFIVFLGSLFASSLLRAADTLPNRLSDDAFWRMVNDFSEDGGYFPYENLLSNELSYQSVIPQLQMITTPGGVYLGVGPEQNFTYIAALQPKIAFIVDIRRQNMLELLMYKGLFELSANRADFVSRLFSRERVAGLSAPSTAKELFEAYESVKPSRRVFLKTISELRQALITEHHFELSADDQRTIQRILGTFMMGGPEIDYGFPNSFPSIASPSYSDLMTATDFQGGSWSYLASEEYFVRVREMHQKNLIIPVVGDFAGNKAIQTIAFYLRQHDATVTAFYVSNVEQYLKTNKTNWLGFRWNVGTLPINESSTFVRFTPPSSTTLEPISEFTDQGVSELWQLLGMKHSIDAIDLVPLIN